jgi:hypothetical protein
MNLVCYPRAGSRRPLLLSLKGDLCELPDLHQSVRPTGDPKENVLLPKGGMCERFRGGER